MLPRSGAPPPRRTFPDSCTSQQPASVHLRVYSKLITTVRTSRSKAWSPAAWAFTQPHPDSFFVSSPDLSLHDTPRLPAVPAVPRARRPARGHHPAAVLFSVGGGGHVGSVPRGGAGGPRRGSGWSSVMLWARAGGLCTGPKRSNGLLGFATFSQTRVPVLNCIARDLFYTAAYEGLPGTHQESAPHLVATRACSLKHHKP